DPELAADLLPRQTPADPDETNTTQPFDLAALGLLTEVDTADSGLLDDGSVNRTTATERHPVTEHAPAAPATTPPARPSPVRAPSRPSPVVTTARRRSARGPLILFLALLLVAGVGLGAWWFGWARYTSTPAVLGLDEVA